MVFVQIIRDSIKINPDAGKTKTAIQTSPRIATFKCTAKIPDHLLPMVEITVWNNDGSCEGIIINPDDYILFMEVKNISIEVNNNIEYFNHRPAPKYLYEFEKTYVKCQSCNNDVLVNNIEVDYDTDGYRVENCPICFKQNTFEEIRYENINDVVKNREAFKQLLENLDKEISYIVIDDIGDVNYTERISLFIAKVNPDYTIGDYVLSTKFSDCDPNDPWCVGQITEIGNDETGMFIKIDACGGRKWRYAKHLTADEGKQILEKFKKYR